MPARADVRGAYKRLLQEMAAHGAMRQNALASLREVITAANKQEADARKLIGLLQPVLQNWVDDGQPDDPQMRQYRDLYMKAVETLHDAEYARQHASNLLETHDEEGLPNA